MPNMLIMVAQAAAGLVETYFIGKLGTDALAGVALVFPVVMLMQMMSAGAMGGGIASSIARALGAGRRADANALALHALIIALGLGAAFTIAVVGGGRWLYQTMGGSGRALEAALTYSNFIFAGAVLVWLFNSLGAVLRGTGNMAFPAAVSCIGVVILVPASPALIFGWGPFPALGIAGGAVALVSYYVLGCVAFVAYLWGGRSLLHPSLRAVRFRWPLFRDILRVGAVAALVTVATNLTIMIGTAFVGEFGPGAIAGYGTGARLEYLLVPLVFGLGAPLVAIVGTSIGAGQRERAMRTGWIGAAMAFILTEAIGLCAAAFPTAWLSLFGTDPQMLEAGATYLRTVGPFYGMFGLALSLYFASQGAGRLLWPLLGTLARLAIAALAGWLALRWTGELSHVFLAQSVGLIAAGFINLAAVAGGAWFGSLTWPWSTAAALQRRPAI
jgi:putative MATE family efflux protein